MISLTEKEKKAIDELLIGLKKLYGANLRQVILYGSKARGEANEGSDIDIMVVLKDYEKWDEEHKKVFELVYSIEEKYGYDLLISTVIKKEKEYVGRNTPLLLNVRKEGIRL